MMQETKKGRKTKKKFRITVPFLIYIFLKLFKFGKTKKVFLPGIVHPIYLRSKTSDISTFRQIFVHKEYDIQLDFQPQTIVDAGANIGLAAIYFANRYPGTKIIAIEPERSNYSMLAKNAKAYTNVSPMKRALTAIAGQLINVIDNGLGNWGFLTASQDSAPKENIIESVETSSVDQIIEVNGLEYIDI